MPYTRRPFNPLSPYPNQVVNESNQANDNFDLLAQSFVNNDPATFIVKNARNADNAVNADTVDGVHASLSPAPNTLLPLNANARIYDYVPRGDIVFDPPDFTMTNGVEYFVGSVNITTPSWSPSGAWKLMFVVRSRFYAEATGVNNFVHCIKTTSYALYGGYWFWNAGAGHGMGVGDCFLIPDLSNGTTQQFSFYVVQGGGSVRAVFQSMSVEWYLFPA